MARVIKAADLFCGAGGTSTGLIRACQSAGYRVDLLAINHWNIAIATHLANHPNVRHLCESLDNVDPRKAVPGGRLDLLVASPECTHHSIARGGRPISDQSRASAWHVLRWCEALRVENVLIENVKEFQTWGPIGLTNRPLKRQKGAIYVAFLNALRSLGYNVDVRVLNCADFGDPTTRERLFILAKRGRKSIVWPEPSHAPRENIDMFGTRQPWRTAREIIDWSIPSPSLRERKRPLSPNTLRRIAAGLKKFGGKQFIVPFFGEREGQTPRVHSVDDPLPAVTSHGAGGICEPFLVILRGQSEVRAIDKPLPTVTNSGAHLALCEPFVLGQQSGSAPRSVDEPLPTVAAGGAISLVQPFLIHTNHAGGERVHSVDKPVPTVTGAHRGELALIEPFLVQMEHSKAQLSHRVDKPMPTITSADAWGLVQPFLVKYNSTGQAQSVDEPLDTVTAKDRFGLVIPDGAMLDIRFRMLQPHELARAQGFPDDYEFKGTREQIVRQIGNAVPCNTAQALCEALIA